MKTIKTIFTIGFLLFFLAHGKAQSIVINEIMTSNSQIIADNDGSYEDWIELFNASTESVDLKDYGLSDDAGNLFKWIFPTIILEPGQHLLIWCSDKNRTDSAAPLHTNFKLSSSGETITITHSSGQIIDQLAPIVIPSNFSYGRYTSGAATFAFFNQPTPNNFNNTQGYTEVLSPPQFSVNSGFFPNGFELTLSHQNPLVSIIYTLDGSEPDPANLNGKTYSYKNNYQEFPENPIGELLEKTFTTLSYHNPIQIIDRSHMPDKIAGISTTVHQDPYYIPNEPIFKGTVVRIKAYKDGAYSSETKTNTYFITPEQSERFSIPVISLSLDENLYFDYENGIGVAGKDFDDWRALNPTENAMIGNANYNRSGDQNERKANFSYFVNGLQTINQNIGIRISGGFSRYYPNKSLVLYARSEYGNSSFDYGFFRDSGYDSFKRLVLRNSGNDVFSTYFRDAFIQKAVSHMNFATQDYQPAITFINGEYWGLLNMRERYDKHYFERKFNIQESELDFLEYNGYLVQEGDSNHYSNMLTYIHNNSLQDAAAYDYIKTQMDVENFTDFFIASIYANNTDWPHNNIEFWRKRTSQYQPNAPYGQDGRWRWVLKDTDYGFGLAGGDESYKFNTLAFASSASGAEYYAPEWSTFIFRKLLDNNSFKTNFINRFADMMNTTYLPDRLNAIINHMKDGIDGEIIEHGQRWKSIGSLEQWNQSTNGMMLFANQRSVYQRQHIRERFEIENNINVNLDVSDELQGYIKINTIELLETTPGVEENPYPWTGIYFKSIPLTLTALAKPGFEFTHWSGDSDSTDSTIVINPQTDIELTAHFREVAVMPTVTAINFWNIDSAVANDTPLTEINSSFEIAENAILTFQSCLEGYPFNSAHPNWRKASMERRNSPTAINYLPEANYNIPFETSNMRGIQIKQPFRSNDLENQMIFDFSTAGYENIVFGFAAKNENAAESIIMDYSTSASENVWTTAGLSNFNTILTNDYQLFETDFSAITAVADNPNFKVRLRFTGPNMFADDGNRVTFNNFSLKGTALPLEVATLNGLDFKVYPNPVANELHLVHSYDNVKYRLFSMDGKLLKNEDLDGFTIDMASIQNGIYLLELTVDDRSEIRKIIKK